MKVKLLGNFIKYLPNSLSLFRVFCAPIFLIVLYNNFKIFSFLVLLCGVASDFFDGYLARKLKVASKIGELLDPLADKLFSNAVLWGICFYREAPYPTLLVTISLTVRDFVLLVGSGIVLLKKLTTNIKPIYASKICTALVFALCILSVVFDPNLLPLKILGILCFIFIILTFFEYARKAFKNAYSLYTKVT